MDALLNVFACRKSSVHEEAMLAVVSPLGRLWAQASAVFQAGFLLMPMYNACWTPDVPSMWRQCFSPASLNPHLSSHLYNLMFPPYNSCRAR